MVAEATPRPWRTVRNNSVFRAGMPDAPHRVIFSQRPGPDVAYCPPVDYDKGNANADLIVRAVNAHDALVEALQDARDVVDAETLHCTRAIHFSEPCNVCALKGCRLQDAIHAADTALALAKG